MTTLLEIQDTTRSQFSRLMPRDQWQALPAGTRARFGTVFTPHATRCYVGQVISARMSRAGWLLAQACRLIGSPLPLFATPGPAAVTVTDHEGNGGQVWARCYHRRRGFAQCVQSVKRFAGPTGLEEYLGLGLSMPLILETHAGALIFRSAGYQLLLGRRRIDLPRLLYPGELVVTHREVGDDAFVFEMTLSHPLLGELIHQRARFVQSGS